MKTKPFCRCACCDQEFDSEESCREHFRSDEHNVVAIPAWIRYVAKMHRDSERRNNAAMQRKSLDSMSTSW